MQPGLAALARRSWEGQGAGRQLWAAALAASARAPASQELFGLSTKAQCDKVAGGYRLEPTTVRSRFLPTQKWRRLRPGCPTVP